METEFNPEATIAKINSLSAMGAPGTEIARKLNEEGLKTSTGLSWNRARLQVFKHHMKRRCPDRPKPDGKRVLKTADKPAARGKPNGAGSPELAWILPVLSRTDWSAEKKIRVISACLEP